MIINADDFGYSKSVNCAVKECFKNGVVNRTTIMVNMPYAEDAAHLARENGFFDKVGLHLNLTEGKALSKECAMSPLCDENGNFKGIFHIPLKSRIYLVPKIRRAIYAETEEQIKKYINMGFTLFHIDSHNYTHSYISVYSQVRKLMKKYHFKSVRISRNVPKSDFSVFFKMYKIFFNNCRLKRDLKFFSHSQYFGSVWDFERCENKNDIKYDIELMTHPVFINGEIVDNTLPKPMSFVTKEWIKKNDLHMDEFGKIKLLICFIHEHIGGAMTSLVNFLNALDTDKYDVDVMFYENSSDRCGIKDGINILPQGKIHEKYGIGNILKKIFSPAYIFAQFRYWYYKKVKHNMKKAVQILSKQGCKYSRKIIKKYDVAVAYESDWCLNYVMKRVNADKKILWNHVEFEKSGLDFDVDKKAFDKADALVFVSESCRQSYLHKHPEYGHKSYYVPNLLSTDDVRAKGNREVCLPFENEGNYIKFLTVARIKFEHKGLDRAVNVFAQLKNDGLLENVRWLIIGKGSDERKLSKMIEDNGLRDYVYMIGAQENPIPYMKKCDVFFLPSRHEGKPMAVTEGFIMGLVPVVTEYTSANEQIKNGVDGLIFENNDEALYEGLKKLLENPQILYELKQNVSAFNYGNEKEIEAFDKLIKDLLRKETSNEKQSASCS